MTRAKHRTELIAAAAAAQEALDLERIKRIRVLYNTGHTIPEALADLKISKNVLMRLRRRAGFVHGWAQSKPKPYSRPNAWTEADLEKLRTLIRDGHSSASAAAALGRSVEAVQDKRLQYFMPSFKQRPKGAALPRWKFCDLYKIANLCSGSIGQSEAARQLGITKSTLSGIAFRHRNHFKAFAKGHNDYRRSKN